jgi:hypothetical protein
MINYLKEFQQDAKKDTLARIRVVLTSRSPGLLMNSMTEETLESLRTGVRKSKPKDVPILKQAESVLYRVDGRLGIPVENLYACLVEAGRAVKLGQAGSSKKMVSNADATELFSFFDIEEEFLFFDGERDPEWRPFPHRGRLKDKARTAVCIVRPRIPHWNLTFHCTVDTTLFDPKRLPELLIRAGRSIGLCDWRPGCKGRFGRFVIAECQQVEMPGAEAEEKVA